MLYDSDKFFLDSSFWGWLYHILRPIEWLMTQIMAFFHKLFVLTGMSSVGLSWILSIVALVLVVHICLLPIYIRQIHNASKMQALQPKIMKIQKKYKGRKDPASREARNKELMRVYKENNTSPVGGSFLLMLVQGPVFMCMFYVLSVIPFIARGKHAPLGAFNQAEAQDFANTDVFGLHIGDRFGTATGNGRIIIAVFIAAMCLSMWFMQFNNMRKNMPEASMEGPQRKVQQIILWIFPLMYIFSGLTFPFAVLVYWLMNNILNLARSMWQIYAMPTPNSPAARVKEERDYRKENERRARAGELSIEQERLEHARQEAERRQTFGYQRVQPKKKRKK